MGGANWKVFSVLVQEQRGPPINRGGGMGQGSGKQVTRYLVFRRGSIPLRPHLYQYCSEWDHRISVHRAGVVPRDGGESIRR